MIKINCDVETKLKLVDMTPFQGDLKKRTQQNLDALKDSLLTEGLLMPFAVWCHDGKNMLLDGHGRREALIQLALSDVTILDVEWPALFIKAETEDDAKKALLQITSSYGKVTKQGALSFVSSIPNYVAPSVSKYVNTGNIYKEKKLKNNLSNKYVIKIQVSADRVEQVKDILKQIDYIKVL